MTDDVWTGDSWPVAAHGRCPKCGRFTRDRVAHRSDEVGWITAVCARCGPVELPVVGWMDATGQFA